MNKKLLLGISTLLLLVVPFVLGSVTTDGDVTDYGDYLVAVFNSSTGGDFTFNTTTAMSVEILIIGGGGSGGFNYGGGGGAGGVIYNTSYYLTSGSHTIHVGRGGLSDQDGTAEWTANGENTTFDALIAYGGGRGSSVNHDIAYTGGSGGGGSSYGANLIGAAGVSGQGWKGGTTSGTDSGGSGGGGCYGSGGNTTGGTSGFAQYGGSGCNITITNETLCFAQGGPGTTITGALAVATCGAGAAVKNSGVQGISAINGTGSGGGGGASGDGKGGSGASGIVMIKYTSGEKILFISSVPSDLTEQALFTYDPVFNYNISESTTTNIQYLNFTTNRTNSTACRVYYNGTCLYNFGEFIQSYTSTNSSNVFNFTGLGENEIYPINTNLLYDGGTSNNTYSLSNKDVYLAYEIINMSKDTNENYFELMVNSSTSSNDLEFYYCNNSYSFNNQVISDSNCVQIYTLVANNPYNHCHSASNCHQLIPVPINSSTDSILGVGVTNTSYILWSITTNPTDNWNTYYYLNQSREGVFRYTNNNGNSWTNISGTPNAHIHQFNSTDSFIYQACANYSGGINCSTFTTDILQFDPLPPSTPNILTPTYNESIADAYYNITWTPSFSSTGTINYYNVTIYDENLSFVDTINDNVTNAASVIFNMLNYSLSIGNYYIKVSAYDNQSFNVSDIQPFKVEFNSLLNVTAINIINGSIIPSFIVNLTNLDNSSSIAVYSTLTGTISMPVTFGTNYNISVIANNFSYVNASRNLTISNTSRTEYFNLYQTNTINITYLYEGNHSLVNDINITLEIISDTVSDNFTTSNGTMYLPLLSPESYTMRYRADGFSERFYYLNLINGSFNSLILYMIYSDTASNITVTVVDENLGEVSGAFVKALKYDIGSNSYLLQEVGQTNVNGETILSLTKYDEYYKFIVELDGEMLLITNPSYITANSITLQINTGSQTAQSYNDYLSLNYDLVFNTGTNNFRLDYSDSNGIISGVCLEVVRLTPTISEVQNSSCSSSASGTIIIPVTEINNTLYTATATYLFDGEYRFMDRLSYYFEGDNPLGNLGIFLQAIITVIMVMIGVWSLPTASIAAPLSLLLGKVVGLNAIGYQYLIPLMTVGIIVALITGRRSA